MPYTYIVECKDGSFYTGSAKDLEARIKKHNEGRGARYTRSRRPVTLVYARHFELFNDALKEEIKIKSLTRLEKMNLIKARDRK